MKQPTTKSKVLKRLIFMHFFLLFSTHLFGQDDQFKVKPQITSPNVAAFLRYGEYSVGVNTGVPDIKVPLFNIQSGSLSYGVDIDYNASGIKVSQLASSVGLGWSLNYGGMISRAVKGLPDEYVGQGYIDLNVSYGEKHTFTTNEQKYKYAYLLNDGEADIFNFRLPTGEGGKFIYDLTKRKFVNDFDPGITIDWVNKSSYKSSSFVLTTTNGTKYYFEQTQITFDDSAWEIPLILKSYIQSWFISKVENTKGESIAYQYETVPSSTILPSGQSVRPEWLVQKSYVQKYMYSVNPRDNHLPKTVYEENLSYFSITEPRIKEITMKSGRIQFNYNVARYDFPGHQLNSIDVYANNQIINKISFAYDYFVADNPKMQYDYRLKLDGLSIGVSNDQKYAFKYDMSHALPSVNSTAQDYWGYYNGRVSNYLPKIKPVAMPGINTNDYVGSSDRSMDISLVQSGILKEITYPTGGKTKFTFEPNSYIGQSNVELSKTYGSLKVIGKSKKIPVHDTVDFIVDQNILNNTGNVNIYFSPLKPPSPYYSPPDMQVVRLYDLTNNQTMAITNRSTNYLQSESHSFQIPLINGHRYRLITTVIDEPSDNLYTASYVEASVTGKFNSMTSQTIFADGVRVQAIENFDYTGVFVNRDEFTYSIGKTPRELKEIDNNHYFQNFKIDYKCSDLLECECFYDRNYLVYTGQANIMGPTIFGRHIYYESVQKIQYNGKNEKIGKIGYTRNVNMGPPFSFHFPNAPYQKEFVNNMSFVGNQPSETYYKWDNSTNKFILQRSIGREYQVINTRITEMKIFKTKIYINNTCAYGRVFRGDDMFGNTPYVLHLPAYRLSKESIIDYDATGTLITSSNITESQYDVNYGQVRTSTLNTSDGKLKRNYFTYPYDYNDNNNFLAKLKEKNVIANPIEAVTITEDSGNKRIVVGKYYTYDNFTRLNSIHTLKVNTNGTATADFKFSNRLKGFVFPDGSVAAFQPDAQYEKRIECVRYDEFNNLSEILENGNLSTVYLWGYGGQYPIAEIKNATYAEVFAVLKEATINSLSALTVSDQVITDAMNKLRADPQLAKAMVTSYTYKPLIGMSSKTDPRGVIEHYEYDGMLRLKAVLDQVKNVTTAMEYHYRTN